MKRQLLYSSLFAVLLLAGLYGCSEEMIPSATGDAEKQNARLTVQVTDGGYISSAGEEPLTRTQEEDYKTTFTTGDKIGLYAVKNNAIITGYNNVCLTLAADGTWTPPADTELFYEGSDATYYLYYPYQENMTGKVTITATDVNSFFKPLVDGWTPPTDQSNYARYTASDLMTGSGTVSNNPGSMRTLTVGLTHRMAMAVINLPHIKYMFDTDADYVWRIYPTDTEFNGFSPYQADNGSFRYLVKPVQTTLTLSGSYSNTTPATMEWYMTANIAAGNYKNYKVDGAAITEITHTLQVGDFYMKDGSLLTLADDETLTAEQKANCVGVVFYIGQNADDNADYSSTGIGQSKCHGYVVSLKYVGSYSWGPTNERVGTQISNSGWRGYSNLQIMEQYAANKGRDLSTYPAAYYSKNYTPVGPANSSGWFLPATGQVSTFYGNRGNFNKQIAKAGGSNIETTSHSTSSELASAQTHIIGIDSGNGVYTASKGDGLKVRPVLAF